jgi:hypothetical protein
MAETVNPESHDPRTLSLYIATLILESEPINYIYSTSIFIGIKSTTANTGQRYGSSHWVWSRTLDWEFSRDAEYCEAQLPKLSEIMQDKEIASSDEFTLCVQIGSPAGSSPSFCLPGQLVVPESVVAGLQGLIDSPTGDVRFVCLEHLTVPVEDEDRLETQSRKRVLYAHSEVLKSRGDYFKDLLTGGFAESEVARRGDAKYTTILVDDAGFVTVYWMLR